MTYDYKCQKCNKVSERLVSYAERDKQKCSCGQKLIRLISKANVIFKTKCH